MKGNVPLQLLPGLKTQDMKEKPVSSDRRQKSNQRGSNYSNNVATKSNTNKLSSENPHLAASTERVNVSAQKIIAPTGQTILNLTVQRCISVVMEPVIMFVSL